MMDLLTQALARGPEPADTPFTQEWPGRRALALEIAAALVPPVIGIATLALFVGIAFVPQVFAFIGVMLALAAAFPIRNHFTGIRRLTVDSDGVEVITRRGSRRARWATVSGIRAHEDLTRLRLDAQGGPFDIDLGRLGVNERLAVIDAMRARVSHITVTPWPNSGWRWRGLALSTAAGIGFIAFGAAFSLDYVGYSMGMRCSGPSNYMEERFDVPPGPGCVVIGVSGAAERAGLRQGDKIIEQDGHPITSGPQFFHRFYDEDTGGLFVVPARKMRFTVLRGGEPEPLHITLTHGPGGGIELPETDPLYWFRKARAREGEDPQKGIEEYTRAIELAPDFDLAYLYRGDLYLFEVLDSQAAWRDYTRALELNPDLAQAHNSMGWLWSNGTGDELAKAESYARRALELDGCDGGFTEYNYDCRSDYELFAYIQERRGNEAAAREARTLASTFYPE